MELKFVQAGQIEKPIDEVFAAIIDPDKLSKYFTTKGGASGPLEEGKIVRWWNYIDVHVVEIIENKLIRFRWGKNEAEVAPGPTLVEMKFTAVTSNRTLVEISEGRWANTQKGLDESYSHAEGWMNMLCCLKAWLEHGINLRENFYPQENDG
jgi:uncharacterized protein YndB with AHSA1/START domain